MTKADTGMLFEAWTKGQREKLARARIERRREPSALQPAAPSDEVARLEALCLRHQADEFSAAVNRPTPERLEQAQHEAVDVHTDEAGVMAVRMLDTGDSDRRRMRALPKVNRWAAETLRRVYLLAHREPCVTASYGANRRPGELPEHVAYAEVLVARCRRQAGRHWPVLRAALVDEGWRVRDERALRFAMRWLAGWWRRVEVTEGAAWEDLATELSLRIEDDERPALTPWHEWLMLACGEEGLPVQEVPRFADEIGADVLAVLTQLNTWRCQGLVCRRDGGWRVAHPS